MTFVQHFQAYIKQGQKFSGRPQIPVILEFSKHGLVFRDYGETWKVQRKFGLSFLREYVLLKEAARLNISFRD